MIDAVWAIERDERSAAYFDAAASGQLLIRQCPSCGELYAPHQDRCIESGELLEWKTASGRATLVTWAHDHATPATPELLDASGTGSLIAIVELEEGLWIHAALIRAAKADLREGTSLTVDFIRPGGGEAVAVFRP